MMMTALLLFLVLVLVLVQNVEGVPRLELNAGADAVGLYVSGGSSDGVLTFLYTVSDGDNTPDLDTDGQNALVLLEGSTIEVGTKKKIANPLNAVRALSPVQVFTVRAPWIVAA